MHGLLTILVAGDVTLHLHVRKRSVTTCVFTSVDLPTYMWTTEHAIVYQHATTSLHAEQLPCKSSMHVFAQRNARYDVATLPLDHSMLSFLQTQSISTEPELVASYHLSKNISNHFLCSTIHQLHFL
jgi:hypothetical protein